jgi:hypothetical protein
VKKDDDPDPPLAKEWVMENIKMALNLTCSALNAVKDGSTFTSAALAIDTLAGRDSYLQHLDRLVPEDSKTKLRSATFTGSTLFSGKVEDAKEELEKEKNARPKVTVNVRAPPSSSQSRPNRRDDRRDDNRDKRYQGKRSFPDNRDRSRDSGPPKKDMKYDQPFQGGRGSAKPQTGPPPKGKGQGGGKRWYRKR